MRNHPDDEPVTARIIQLAEPYTNFTVDQMSAIVRADIAHNHGSSCDAREKAVHDGWLQWGIVKKMNLYSDYDMANLALGMALFCDREHWVVQLIAQLQPHHFDEPYTRRHTREDWNQLFKLTQQVDDRLAAGGNLRRARSLFHTEEFGAQSWTDTAECYLKKYPYEVACRYILFRVGEAYVLKHTEKNLEWAIVRV